MSVSMNVREPTFLIRTPLDIHTSVLYLAKWDERSCARRHPPRGFCFCGGSPDSATLHPDPPSDGRFGRALAQRRGDDCQS